MSWTTSGTTEPPRGADAGAVNMGTACSSSSGKEARTASEKEANDAPSPKSPSKPRKNAAVGGAKSVLGQVPTIDSLPKIPKSPAIRQLIVDAVKDNLLFRARLTAAASPQTVGGRTAARLLAARRAATRALLV